ncbi:AraC family transcriptional regulator [Undibacterium sp. TS12]|uniref:helix-turn-helix domain-containing protein n=1 Tax=Undibacterium sp. TS12 TaxID=2908202 RepID=UPI001F4CF431|nr:AraC family transcriptional regulator [Undibacterium sp. TS12]MCH8617903.1 AraC family transcriptional regulator [Undibacterium sp. TS12]
MSEPTLDSPEGLVDWFRRGGVTGPLRHCTGPLPLSRASIVRWSSDKPDTTIQTIGTHADNYRIAVLLEPLESQIWNGESPVCGGMIGANRFRICPPGSQGRWRRMSSCDIVNIFIPTATINTLGRLRDAETPSLLADTSYTPDRVVLDLVGKLLNAQLLAGSLAQQFCDSMITALASYLLENYSQSVPGQKPSSLCGTRLQKVLAHISECVAEDVSIAALADSCAMSESHFSREFRKAVGLPPHQYVMKLRLERASLALLEGDARIIDIAVSLGFNNVSHFSRAFAMRYGLPPAIFRRNRHNCA